MHEASKNRRDHLSSLQANLKEIEIVRADLLRKLEELEAQSKVLQLEYNSLYNLDAPSSSIPDEILATIFEVGTLIEQIRRPRRHFGVIVSHVTQRWRAVALSTPRLWTKIRCSPGARWHDRIASYFHRSKVLPIDLMFDDIQNIQPISDHFGRCRRFFIRSTDDSYLSRMLEWALSQSTSILEAIDLNCDYLAFDVMPLSRSVPSLTSVHITGIETHPHVLQFCRPLLGSLTSLHIAGLVITDMASYMILRDALITIHSLTQLELHLRAVELSLTNVPVIVLPTLQLLCVDTKRHPRILSAILLVIHATSLRTISLAGWETGVNPANVDSLALIVPSQFPILRDLKLTNQYGGATALTPFTNAFPHVVHLTYHLEPSFGMNRPAIDNVLDVLADLRWSNLQTISLSGVAGKLEIKSASRMREVLLLRSSEGCPIRTLRVPLKMPTTEKVTSLKEYVKIEEYVDDWPAPFPSW